VPAIAFSMEKRGYQHLDAAAGVARGVIERWVRRPLAGPVLLNVNIPSCEADALQGIRVTRLGRRHLAEPVVKDRNPRGDTIWWIGPAGSAREAGPGTDFHAVAERWVSITPLDVDLTGTRLLPEVENWAAGR
jgi:5'-nucleotidase